MSEQPGSLAAALVQLQASLPRITKDESAEVRTKEGRAYSYTYATLDAISATLLPLLANLGLYWTCQPTLQEAGDRFVLRYRLVHAGSGEQLGGEYPLGEGSPQTLGGRITYGRRQCLLAVTGVAPAEDDDNAQETARAHEERQNTRTRYVAEERASTPMGGRPAERARSRVADDAWETPDPEHQPGSITPAQLKSIHAKFTKLGIADRDDRLAYVMSKLDLPGLGSSKDLTMAQASDLIKHLDGEAAG